jgi:hypothetical protein
VIAVALVFGTILVIDLRMIGKASTERPFMAIHTDIVKWTWLAFVAAFITGGLMFTSNPTVYYHNNYFRAKMLLLGLAGINMTAFELTLGRRSTEWGHQPAAPGMGRWVGVLSLAIWLAVIFTGRMIGFTSTRTAIIEQPAGDVPALDDLFETTPEAPKPAPDTQ